MGSHLKGPSKRKSSSLLIVLSLIILALSFLQFQTLEGLTPQVAELPVTGSKPEPPSDDTPRRLDNNSTFSACLLVSDDNHYLVEWLAYHYVKLPLRYLVITRDPRARTTPKAVLDRWEEHMTIVRWNDRRFMPEEWLHRFPAENDPVGKLMKHRERQRHFYPACFEFLRRAGRQWVMVIDVDEFVVQNQYFERQEKNYSTVLEAFNDLPPYNLGNSSCVTMPRLRFGNFEDESSLGRKLTPYLFRDKDFLTYRFRWRADLHSKKENRHPKSTINVARIHNFSRQDTDAHRPVRSACPKRNMYIMNEQSPFTVHHYVGSREQFLFRKDARDGTETRGNERLQSYGSIKSAYDESACGWLDDFVDGVGFQSATSLLEDAGSLMYTTV